MHEALINDPHSATGSWHRPEICSWSRDGSVLYVRAMQFRGMELPEREYLYAGRIRGALVCLEDVVPMVEASPDDCDQVGCMHCKRVHRLSGTTIGEIYAKADGWRLRDEFWERWICNECLEAQELKNAWDSDA